jgi:hypothetical protein
MRERDAARSRRNAAKYAREEAKAAKRVGDGRYVVPSSTQTGVAYSVQVLGERGVCDCIGSEGAERAGHQCKHIRQAIEQEKSMTETTALATREDTYAPIEVQPPSALLPTHDELKVMVTIANSVYKTSGKLIPKEIKSSEEAFAIMLAGRELGIQPMASFREVFIVNGRTMPSARVLMGLVQAGDPGAIFKWIERSADKAHVRLTRSNGQAIEVEYTMEDAKLAGLTGNDVWKRYPKDMLAYKAVTRACRLGGADLITGIGATIKGAPAVMQAIEDDGDDDMPVLEAAAEPSHRVAPADGRGSQEEPDDVPLVGAAKLRALIAEAREKWRDDDGRFEAWANGVTQRYPILLDADKLGKITDDEADAIYDALVPDVMSTGSLV